MNQSSGTIIDLIERAFDYRGDVTIDLEDGQSITGFVCNRIAPSNIARREPFIEVMVAGRPDRLVIPYARITRITFTGTDQAAGKSFADSIAKQTTRESHDPAQSPEPPAA